MQLNPLKKIMEMKSHTSTKFCIINFIVTMVIVFFVSVILPILSIWFPVIVTVIDKLNPASIIVALLGQSGVATAVNTIRLALESKAEKMRENGEPGI